jgi:hypothetical protein
MSKESCETTCKQHSKTSTKRNHYCEKRKLQNNLGKTFIEVVERDSYKKNYNRKKKR